MPNDTTIDITASASLREDVALKLADSGKKVRDIVVSELADCEINKRKNAVLSILVKIDDKIKEIRKAEGAGSVVFDRVGNRIGEPSFTKSQLDEIKKIGDDINRMQVALEKAFVENDFQKLLELSK